MESPPTPHPTPPATGQVPARSHYSLRPQAGDHLLPDDMAHAPFPVYFRKLRIRSGRTQTDLARLVGLSVSTLNYAEKPKPSRKYNTPSREIVLELTKWVCFTIFERDALLYKAGHAPVIDWMQHVLAARREHSQTVGEAAPTETSGYQQTTFLPLV